MWYENQNNTQQPTLDRKQGDEIEVTRDRSQKGFNHWKQKLSFQLYDCSPREKGN